MIVSITDAPSINFTFSGCEQCLIATLAVLFNDNEKFRSIMRKAALMNEASAMAKVQKRHDN